MAYITYAEYQNYGGTLNETSYTGKSFKTQEPWAELLIDTWTLGRMKSLETIPEEAKRAITLLIDMVEGIKEGFATVDDITSFSNGVTNFGFAAKDGGTGHQAYIRAYEAVTALLPVELCSACTSYGDVR
jgi:hypothetical protein